MIKSLSNITDISVVDQNIKNSLYFFSNIEFNDDPIGSGGFGFVYNVFSIDGKPATDYVLKIYSDEIHKQHAYDTIKLLHEKIKTHQYQSGLPIYYDYPELLGMPFMTFVGFDRISSKKCVAFLMYNLNKLGYNDYGAENSKSYNLVDLPVVDKLYLAYQLAKIAEFLHSLDFIHSDLNEHSLFFNLTRIQLSIIDFDSGYHFDIQDKPSTIGKISQWIGGRFRNIIGKRQDSSLLTTEDRIYEEYWILANAIFEVIFGVMPFFFLTDADDKIKKSYLKEFEWPNIDYSSALFNFHNAETHKIMLANLDKFEKAGARELISAFRKVFNKGYGNDRKRLSASEWKALLYQINILVDSHPLISKFVADKTTIRRKNENVSFSWIVSKFNALYINNELVPLLKQTITLGLEDSSEIIFLATNDFNHVEDKIIIKAEKIAPLIQDFKASKYFRDGIDPIILSWETMNTDHVSISGIDQILPSAGSLEVFPQKMTNYELIAIGYFNEKVASKIEIEVISPIIKELYWKINIAEGIDNVDLYWKTENAGSVIISPKVGEQECNGIVHVAINGKTTFTLVAQGLFSRVEKEIEAYPFPVPLIESILVPEPILSINTNVSVYLPFFSSKSIIVPSPIDFHNKKFQIQINPNNLYGLPELVETKFQIEKIPFMQRIRILYSELKNEFLIEKGKKYGTEK